MRAMLAAAAAAAAILAATAQATATAHRPAPVIAAYYAGYDADFAPGEIDAGRLTDLIYAFGAIDARDRCALAEPAEDVGAATLDGRPGGNFGALEALEARDPALQTEISIGGWAGSARFSAAAASSSTRSAFVRSCIDLFLRRWPGLFDGIDIDWEFPVAGGATPGRPADRRDATLLLAEFRTQLDALGAATHRHYLLTAALPAIGTGGGGGYTPATSWNLAAVARSVDWINLMSYDMSGSHPAVTDFESPLRATPAGSTPAPPAHASTIASAVSFYEAAGVPAEKIVIGAPFYGHVFTDARDHDAGLFQPFGTLGADPSYAQIVAGHLPGAVVHWSPYADEAWVYDRAARTFLTYDDPRSMAAKARYALSARLRGVMAWEIGMDDASHSLLDALSAPLLAAAARARG